MADVKDLFQLAHELVVEGVITTKDVHALSDKMFREVNKRRRLNGDTKEYAGLEFGMTAYKYILDHGGKAEDAMAYALKVHNKTEDWLADVKNRDYYYSKQVVMDSDKHPEQKLMLENKTMDKQALKASRSVNQQVRRLSQYKSVSDILEGLKKTDERQQEEIDVLKATTSGQSGDIQKLKLVAGIKDQPIKEKVLLLKAEGCTQKAVAAYLEVGLRSVQRHWNNS